MPGVCLLQAIEVALPDDCLCIITFQDGTQITIDVAETDWSEEEQVRRVCLIADRFIRNDGARLRRGASMWVPNNNVKYVGGALSSGVKIRWRMSEGHFLCDRPARLSWMKRLILEDLW